jgi:hypothetical protein
MPCLPVLGGILVPGLVRRPGIPAFPAIRRFPAIPKTAIPRLPPLLTGAPVGNLAPVRRRKGLIAPAAVAAPNAAIRRFPAIPAVPPVRPGPAFTGAAAAVIPAYGRPAAPAFHLAVPEFLLGISAASFIWPGRIFPFVAHAFLSCFGGLYF